MKAVKIKKEQITSIFTLSSSCAIMYTWCLYSVLSSRIGNRRCIARGCV